MKTDFVLAVAGLIVGVVGVVLAVVFYRKSRRRKRLCFAARGVTFVAGVADKFSGVALTYLGQQIPNLTVTVFAIWNEGNEVVRDADVAPANPVRIDAKPEARILEATVASTPNPANSVRVTLDPGGSSARVTFDFLGPGEGACVRCIHTGFSGDDLIPAGTIIGAGDLTGRRDVGYTSAWRLTLGLLMAVSIALPLVFMAWTKYLDRRPWWAQVIAIVAFLGLAILWNRVTETTASRVRNRQARKRGLDAFNV